MHKFITQFKSNPITQTGNFQLKQTNQTHVKYEEVKIIKATKERKNRLWMKKAGGGIGEEDLQPKVILSISQIATTLHSISSNFARKTSSNPLYITIKNIVRHLG